jgi:translation initiation factor IF-1
MSGSGRKSQYRKSVTDSFLNDDYVPSEMERIVKVLGNRGDNTFEVQFESGDKALARMPKKFNKLIWVKTGDYTVIEKDNADVDEAVKAGEAKEQYSINHILSKPNVKFLKSKGLWPMGLDGEESGRTSGNNVVMRDDLLMPENDEDEDGEYEEDGEEEEAIFDKMGNTVPK